MNLKLFQIIVKANLASRREKRKNPRFLLELNFCSKKIIIKKTPTKPTARYRWTASDLVPGGK